VSRDCGRQGAGPADEWLSTDQLAAELGVTAARIMDWINEGKDIPHYSLGGDHIRFRRSEIAPLLAEHVRDQP
jgi:excisionase family DNA binding protein